MSKILNFFKLKIKAAELRWSDLFLAVGFLFMVPFAALAYWFMMTSNPNEIPFRPWMMIVCFSISVISWGIYFFIEAKKGNVKNNVFLWIYILFAILSIVSILVQPNDFVIDVKVRNVGDLTPAGYGLGDIVPLSIHIPWVHKMFFCFGSLLITTVFYILMMVFPKRIKSLDILILVGVVIYLFLLVLVSYSLITEFKNYGLFLKAFFGGSTWDMVYYAPKSFIAHRVPFGVCMMLGVMYGLVLHGFTKKWYWSIPIALCYIVMFFSYCKTSLVLGALMIIGYTIFEMIRTFKKHKALSISVISVIGAIVLFGALAVLISVVTKGKFSPVIYKVYDSFTNGQTIDTRTFIWRNVETELKGGWWIIGRGFGTHNFILYPMNCINSDPLCPSHSTYYAVLGAGGVINLVGFIGLYCYFGYVFYKSFKVNKLMTIGLSLGFIAFFLYSFTEGVNYLIVVFTLPLIFYYNLTKNVDQIAK